MEQDTPYHSLMSGWYYAGFVQDTYRVVPRVTLNLGVRYDLQLSPVESSNLTATFVPGAQSTKVPSAPLGMLFPGDNGVPRGIADTRLHHISPRVGIAWDPFGDGKTAIRAAGGLFYGSVSGNEWNQPANAQPFAIRQTFNSITSFSNVYGNKSSFPNGDPFPQESSSSRSPPRHWHRRNSSGVRLSESGAEASPSMTKKWNLELDAWAPQFWMRRETLLQP